MLHSVLDGGHARPVPVVGTARGHRSRVEAVDLLPVRSLEGDVDQAESQPLVDMELVANDEVPICVEVQPQCAERG